MFADDGPLLVIDASNICRDDTLTPVGVPCSWQRLVDLTDALERSDIGYSAVHVVADRSLIRHLDEHGQEQLDKLRRARDAEVIGFADERMVDLAYGVGVPNGSVLLVTGDFFDDFRRTHPGIDGSQAIGWDPAGDGRPVPRRRDLGARTHRRVSRKEEARELSERRLRRDDVQQRAASKRFRCTNAACLVARLWPEQIEELPLFDSHDDCFVCPSCRAELEVVGDRRAAVQVVVFAGNLEAVRLLVEQGRPMLLGRVDGPGQVGIERHVAADIASSVSRTHVGLAFDGSDLIVTDCDSKNGTRLGRRGAPPVEQRAIGREPVVWRQSEVVFLPSGLTMERSGRKLPIGGESADTDRRAPHDVAPTTLVTDSGQRPGSASRT